jgi:hypothetical protein
MAATFPDGAIFTGTTIFAGPTQLKTGCVRNVDIEANAGIATSKLEHPVYTCYGQNGTAVAATVPIHTVVGVAGVIEAVGLGSIVACVGDATITVDVKLNGTTILSAPVELDSTNTARVAVAGVLSVTALAAGDLLEVVIAVDAGTGTLGTGLFVQVKLREDAV